MTTERDPEEFLPLRPVEFEILLVLARGDAHGYAIIKKAEERSGGPGRIETGTLYRALRRLRAAGLVQPSERRPAPDMDDARRTYYAVTPLGRRVVLAEARRLESQVEAARALLGAEEARGGAT